MHMMHVKKGRIKMILTYEEVEIVLRMIIESPCDDALLIDLMIILDQLKELHKPVFLPSRYELLVNKYLPLLKA